MIHNILNKIENPLIFHALILTLVIAYGLIRAIFFSGLSADEAEQVLFAQSFQWGYDIANPPLYTWVLIGLFSIFGKSAGLVIALKYAVLAGIYSALYWAARISLGPHRTQDHVLVGLSPILFFFLSWQVIFNYSHSLLNALLVIFSFIAFVKILKRGHWLWYAALGLSIGFGVLTKYSYFLYLIAFVVAGLSLQNLRYFLLSPKIILTLGIAVIVAAPHFIWLAESADRVVQATNYKLEMGQDISYIAGVGKGLWNLVRASFAFMSPLWLIVLVVFPVFWKRSVDKDERLDIDIFLGRIFLVILALMVSMVLFGGITQFRPNYLFLMILFPLWVFTRMTNNQGLEKRRPLYGMILISGLVLSVGGLGVKAVADPLGCKKCQFLMPYEDMAKALANVGFSSGTIFATWYPSPLPGNLAVYFKNARVISSKFPNLHPSKLQESDQCLLVWVPEKSGGLKIQNWAGLANKALGTNIQAGTPVQELVFSVFRRPSQSVYLNYILLDPGVGECR